MIVAIPYVVFTIKEEKDALLLGSLSEAELWCMFMAEAFPEKIPYLQLLIWVPNHLYTFVQMCGKLHYVIAEREKQSFQSDICAFESKQTLFF